VDVKYEGGMKLIKKILTIVIIISFFSATLFPVITAEDSHIKENYSFYRNSIKINLREKCINTCYHARKVKTFYPSLKLNPIFTLRFLPAIISLNRIINPLNKPPLELSDEDLEALAYMTDCRVVGLGEATHGTKEFFQLKHRIFKYLVENHEFKIFAFECDMGESYFIDNFVTTGNGDLDEIMKEKMHFWTWRTEEVKELLLWMKEYNENTSYENKIHFIGVDCQFLTFQSEIILNYFNKTNVSLPEYFIQFLLEIEEIGQNLRDYYSEMTQEKKEEIDQNVDILLKKFEDFRNELIFNSSEFEYQFVKQIALNIKQVNDFYYSWTHDYQKNLRDLYMAENTLWTSDLFGNNTKVALWAHNGHVNNYRLFGATGFHLKKELKEKYQILGFAFSQGNFTAVKYENGTYYGLAIHHIDKEPKIGSINYIFHNAKYDNFIIRESDIRIISFFNRYIRKPHYFISIGAVFSSNYSYYLPIIFKKHFDVMIYWDTTMAAEQLK